MAYTISQPVPAIIGDGANVVFRPQQPTPPSGLTMPPVVVSRPPGIPPQQLPPPQHILSQPGPHVIGTNPPNLPPGMLPTSHGSGSVAGPPNPPATVLMQTVPIGAPSAVRPTNLITIKMSDEGEFRRSADTPGSAAVRPQFTNQPPPPTHENPLYGQHFVPPRGPPPEHHQMSVRPPRITHPAALPAPSSQLSRPAAIVGLPLSAAPQRLGPPPHSIHSGPPQNMAAPPPQAIQGMVGPPGMHGCPPPQALHAAPPPPQGMHSGPPPPSLHSGPPPPQGLHSGPPPPPQGLPGFPPPARHPPDQHVQLQQMSWSSPGPAGGQVQRMAGTRPSPAPSQSMPFYQ